VTLYFFTVQLSEREIINDVAMHEAIGVKAKSKCELSQ